MRRVGIDFRLRIYALAVSLALVTLLAPVADAAGQNAPAQRWIGAWATSPLRPDPVGTTDQAVLSRTGFENQTLREIVYPHFGGSQVRVRLSNTFGDQPLRIGQTNLALQAEAAAIVPQSNRQLTFGGQMEVVIPAGAQVVSDPVDMQIDVGRTLAISMYLPDATGPLTWHSTARQTLYTADGNESAEPTGGSFEAHPEIPSWYLLGGVEVAATSPDQATIVALGDSITDGTNSSQDANNRWPDFLARRLVAQPANKLSVLDEGIGGNRVLTDVPAHVNALARLDRDVLSQNGVKYVVLLEGINDIGQTCLGNANASTEELLAGYRQIIAQVHLKGLQIFGATMTPFEGATPANPGYFCADGEVQRQALNTFIRTSGEFDGVIDFDVATRDPENPSVFLPAYDSGDHLHPNDAGYEAMANAVDLSLFTR